MILSRHSAVLTNPPEGGVPRPVRLTHLMEGTFIIEYSDLLDHPEVSYTGIVEHDPATGHLIGQTTDGQQFIFDVNQNGALLHGYSPLNLQRTIIDTPGQGEIEYANASLMITEDFAVLTGYGVEIIKFYHPSVNFYDEVTYPEKTADKVYAEKKLELINPYNNQKIVAEIFDQGCGCAVERIEPKLGNVKIYPIGE